VVFYSLKISHPRPFECLVCDEIQEQSYSPDATVFTFNEVCLRMIFVRGGLVKYIHMQKPHKAEDRKSTSTTATGFSLASATLANFINSNQVRRGHCTLSPGSVLCEPMLWCRWHHSGELVSSNCARTLQLTLNSVRHLVDRYPNLRVWGSSHAENFVAAMNSRHVSDLFDSDVVIRDFGRTEMGRWSYDSGAYV